MAAPRSLRLLVLLLALDAAIAVVFGSPGDYPQDAGLAVSLLAGGHLLAALHAEPLMGSLSILLRAPFVALAQAVGVGATGAYQVGAFVCLAPVAALGVALAGSIPDSSPRSPGASSWRSSPSRRP